MVATRASSSSYLGQVLCPKPSHIRVIDCLENLRGRLRGRLYKHLLISMPTGSHTGVSCGWATTVNGLLLAFWMLSSAHLLDLHPGNIAFANTKPSYHQSDTDLQRALDKPELVTFYLSTGIPWPRKSPNTSSFQPHIPPWHETSRAVRWSLSTSGKHFCLESNAKFAAPWSIEPWSCLNLSMGTANRHMELKLYSITSPA